MAVGIRINGTERPLKENTLNIREKVNERSIASFVLVTSVADDVRIKKRQPVRVFDTLGDETIFTGFVDVAVEKTVGTERYHQLTCVDNHYLADKRIFAGSFVSTSATEVVKSIVTSKLLEEGVRFTDASVDGGTKVVMNAIAFDYKSVSDCLDKVAERSGCDWWIDKNLCLWFKKLSDRPVGMTVQEDMVKDGSLKFKNNAHQYRNRQFIKGGRSMTDERTESQFGDGEKVTFTVGFPVAKKPSVAINSVNVDPKKIGIKGLDDDDGTKDWFWTSGSTEITQSFKRDPLAKTDKFTVTYRGYFSTIIISQDTKEITGLKDLEGSSGVVECVDNEPNLDDKQEIFEVANSKLNKYKNPSNKVVFRTTQTGFSAGQLVTINIPSEGFPNDPDYLVDNIKVIDQFPLTWYEITLVKGYIHKSWEKTFASFSNQAVDELIDMEAVEMVILPAFHEKKWTRTDQPNTMRKTICGTGVKVGTIDATVMVASANRNTRMDVISTTGENLGGVQVTQKIAQGNELVSVFVIPTSVAIGEWAKVRIFGGDNDDVLLLELNERRTKTKLDEIQIQLTDINTWQG